MGGAAGCVDSCDQIEYKKEGIRRNLIVAVSFAENDRTRKMGPGRRGTTGDVGVE